MYGSVAQSVEQRTENPCVGGSIPSRATIYFIQCIYECRLSSIGRDERSIGEMTASCLDALDILKCLEEEEAQNMCFMVSSIDKAGLAQLVEQLTCNQ
jgi:hypothetical protein